MRVVKSKRSGQIFVVVAYLVALLAALAVGRASPASIPSGSQPWPTSSPRWSCSPSASRSTTPASTIPTGAWRLCPLPSIGLPRGGAPSACARSHPRAAGPLGRAPHHQLGPALARSRRRGFSLRRNPRKTGKAYWPASLASIHLLPTAWVFLGLVPIFPALTSARLRDPRRRRRAGHRLAIAIETIADRQLRRYLRSPHDEHGILDSGLWSRCRHPNYLGEILFWWGLFLFGMAAHPGWVWSIIGPLSITLLFVFVSVPWMDRRMLSRHPAWAEHMKKTRALVPRMR
jgi:protein-S-isoprenylcysteine O-methyltransferase Ste14